MRGAVMIFLQQICRFKTFWALSLFAVILLAASPGQAGEDEKGWQPPPPLPDEFDWIQLTSGEWLKGEFIAMYDEELEFDSDELDELTLDWEDIQQIRSAQTMQVAFLDNTIAIGKLLMDADSVQVMGEKDWVYPRSQVLSITAGAPHERNYWAGKLSAGFNYRRGNTDQTEVDTVASIQRRTPKNRIKIDSLGTYSKTDLPDQADTVTADSQRVSAAWNRYLSDRFYLVPISGDYYRDPFQNIRRRWSIGVGAGYQIVDTAKVEWTVDAGLGFRKTFFEEVQAGIPDADSSPAVGVGTYYDNELTGWVEFFFDYRFFVVNEASGSYTHHLVTGLEFELIGDLDFDVSWVWDRIKDPQLRSDRTRPESDDFRTIFALSYSF